jgi:thioredoxin 1
MANYLTPSEAPTRAQVDALQGPVVLEFGAGWCGYCRSFEPILQELLQRHPQVTHIRVEDGSGRPLGRSFLVKLWPTLVFMKDGDIVLQNARPTRDDTQAGLEAITSSTETGFRG